MIAIPTKADEVFGKYEPGGFSSSLSFMEHLLEELRIRIKNKQNYLVIIYIFFGKILSKSFYVLRNFFKK